ncbi:MAG: alpha-glucosidase, alpha-glucosidase [Chloroflexi bacterium CSP1-4]|nr:MAG: alpha-glucosidase, alpha-glucosidase [Chloroflexi bacterium CSP1-4]
MTEAAETGPPAALRHDWWRRGVVYQVYPRSFADSDGDGVGDLAGIVAHLDHLNDGTPGSLGVDALWLSPIYPSPGFDVGYDVADYVSVDPVFGSLGGFDRIVTEAHRRGIAVVLDLVMNHTSHLHAWFLGSRTDRHGPYADWYIWRDPVGRTRRGRPRPPNNWVSFFGGPAWTWEPARGQFYLHTFLPQQPDLNWRHPAVRAAMLDVVRFWLARGVDGFRLDVFNAFFKDAALRSNPRRFPGGWRAWDRQRHVYDKDQPEMADLLAEFRALVDGAPGRMSVGELFAGDPREAAGYAAPRHLIFDFRLIGQPWRADRLARAIDEREAAFGPDRWPTVVLSNHDQPRPSTRLARGADRDHVAKAAAMLLLTLRGTPFLYYGDEIGLGDIHVPRREIVDPPARRYWPLPLWWNRDQCRAPMPWSAAPNGGFTTGRPWLRMAPDAPTRNVAAQAADADSVLSFHRRLLWLRGASAALQTGTFRWLVAGERGVLAYFREAPEERVLMALTTEDRAATVDLGGVQGRPRLLLSSAGSSEERVIAEGRVNLRAREAVLLRLE